MNKTTSILSLNIETSTTLCSVSIGRKEECIDYIEIDDGNYHSEKLHLFLQTLLNRNCISQKEISVIATSCGPGSYTGLRVSAAAAKTMAYVLNIPLISISSLRIQALCYTHPYPLHSYSYILSTMKARDKKIYLAIYSKEGLEMVSPHAFIVNDESVKQLEEKYSNSIFIGSGANIISTNIPVLSNISPSSKCMIKETYKRFTEKNFSDLVYFEPMYI